MGADDETMRLLGLGLVDRVFRAPQAPKAGAAPPHEPANAPAPNPEKRPEEPAAHGGDPSEVPLLGWDALIDRISGCKLCKLHKERTNTVPGTGNHEADWLLIGEGPGRDEDLKGEPFVGRAGQLLDRILAAMRLTRQEVYICNVVKCRPPDNRNPEADEAEACRPYLERQIGLVSPKVIVALGKVAAGRLLDTDKPLARLRGTKHEFRGIPVVVTYHPAYLLRTSGGAAKAWADLCLAMRLMKETGGAR